MRMTPQEEYGLRCLLVVAREGRGSSTEPVSIERISKAEGLGYEHAAKIMRALRRGGLVESTRGAKGGFHLTRSADTITVWDALVVLDTPLVGHSFCASFKGQLDECAHASEHCTLMGLWSWVGDALQNGLQAVTLADLLAGRRPGMKEAM